MIDYFSKRSLSIRQSEWLNRYPLRVGILKPFFAIIVIACVCSVWSSSTEAQQSTESSPKGFRWKLSQGQKLDFEFQKKSKVLTDVKGNKRTHQQERLIKTVWTVAKVQKENIQFDVRIGQIDLTVDTEKARILVSSSDDPAVNSFPKKFKALYSKLKNKIQDAPKFRCSVSFDGQRIHDVKVQSSEDSKLRMSSKEIEAILRETWPETPRNQPSWKHAQKGKLGNLPISSDTIYKQEPARGETDRGDVLVRFDTTVTFDGGTNPTKWSKPAENSNDVFGYNPTSDKWPRIDSQKSSGKSFFSTEKGIFLSAKTNSILKTSKPYSDSPILTETTTNTSTVCQIRQ